jgi:regulator of ribonuclease activity A
VRAFSGPIATVRCFEDNVLVKQRVAEPGGGRVLVVDAGASLRCALVGDNVAGLALANGWAGLVVNGCVRDVEALAQLAIGIKALGTNPRPSAKTGEGELDVPVSFGGARFEPGALLASDDDGIVVLPQ